jgi:hypothetical protein
LDSQQILKRHKVLNTSLKSIKIIVYLICESYLSLNIKKIENLYKKYGLHPVQDGSEIGAGKNGVALQFYRFG